MIGPRQSAHFRIRISTAEEHAQGPNGPKPAIIDFFVQHVSLMAVKAGGAWPTEAFGSWYPAAGGVMFSSGSGGNQWTCGMPMRSDSIDSPAGIMLTSGGCDPRNLVLEQCLFVAKLEWAIRVVTEQFIVLRHVGFGQILKATGIKGNNQFLPAGNIRWELLSGCACKLYAEDKKNYKHPACDFDRRAPWDKAPAGFGNLKSMQKPLSGPRRR